MEKKIDSRLSGNDKIDREAGRNYSKTGFSLVEVLVAISLFAIFSTSIFYLSIDTVKRDLMVSLESEAMFYAQEGLEAVRNIRDNNYLLLTNGDHGLNLVDNEWTFVASPEDINGDFERNIVIEDVYRNESGDMDPAGTIYDLDTKKITSEVIWYEAGIIPQSISLTSYLSNWRGDDFIQTTCTEFNAGIFENTVTEVGADPPADNCNIELSLEEEEGEYFSSLTHGLHASDVVVDGNYAYLGLENSSEELAIVDISNPALPVKVADVSLGGKARYLSKDGNYIYAGVQKKSGGLVIVDVSNPLAPFVTSTTNIGDYGNQPTVSGNYLYMASDSSSNSFSVYDVTLKNSPQLRDTIDFNSKAHSIAVSGNFAYVGLDDDHAGFKAVNITDPSNVFESASLDVDEEVNSIKINGVLAYIGIEDHDNSLKAINISDPLNPILQASLGVNGEIQDLVIDGDYLYAAIDETNAGLAVIDLTNPLAPVLLYNLDIFGKAKGIDIDENYVYTAIDVTNKGLILSSKIQVGMALTGTYISNWFDTGSNDTLYNFIEWEHTEVPGGTIRFQVRTADTSENLESAVWVGFDGTNSTYYESSRTQITLDPLTSGSRYCQFKIYIQSDGITSPIIQSVRINYTP